MTPGSFTDVVWDFGDGSYSNEPILSNHVYANVGCYDVTLSLVSEGCPYSLTLDDMVCILPNPVANFVVPESIQSYNNNLFTFENLSQHAEFFNWDFGDGTGSNSIHPIHSYNAPSGIYGVTLVAMNEYGCADTAKFSIQLSEDLLVYVPNAFTPNGDNTNAVFKPIITEGIDIFTYRLLIFNRWGEVLFESLNKEVGWDGTYGGNVMQDGVYVWKLTFNSINDEEEYEFIGHVSLLK
jgi:gliding motility-associated-like protein